MTTRYRVEYALKSHRRDQFIEWIKGLLAVPFVLCAQPNFLSGSDAAAKDMATEAHRRYTEIMKDVENLVADHILNGQDASRPPSKLKLLVPSIGNFFTPLSLSDAFVFQDARRFISSRRFVPPSFNDIRVILNTAQIMSIVRSQTTSGGLGLITFDGDVTLYDDGCSLEPSNPVIPRLLSMLSKGVKVGIVTAAGYTEAEKYAGRLYGLLEAIADSKNGLTKSQRSNLIVMGGESSYLFKFDDAAACHLAPVPRDSWLLDEMRAWSDADVTEVLDIAEAALRDCVASMCMSAQVVRKERAVGIVPSSPELRFPRESLEETVLVVQKVLDISPVSRRIPFCAFNGGNDIFVDIGDKSWGVLACQRYFSHGGDGDGGGPIEGARTLHVGDQFLSAGANDFKARLACTTAWIASPAETVSLLDEIAALYADKEKSVKASA